MSEKIDNRIDFWINLWEDLIANFLKKSYGLSLYNPHILVEDIITEIEENSFRNVENKKYFYQKLCEYFSNDIIIIEKFHSEFKILRSIFNTDRTNYILETARKVNNEFKKGLYFDSCLNLLSEKLLSDEEITLEFINSINYLTQNHGYPKVKNKKCLRIPYFCFEKKNNQWDSSDASKITKNHYFAKL